MATQDSEPDFDEEAIYAAALSELKSGTVRPGLWAKAFAECEGDENKSQALYIRLRVQQERERKLQEESAAKPSAAEVERRKNEEFMPMIERLRLKGYEAKRSGSGWTVREPLGSRVRLESDRSLLEYAEGRVTAPRFFSKFSGVSDMTSGAFERQPDTSLASRSEAPLQQANVGGSPSIKDPSPKASEPTASTDRPYPWRTVLVWAGTGFIAGILLGDAPRHVHSMANVIAYKVMAGITWGFILGLVVTVYTFFKRR